jgi:hypothetical protein
LVSAVSQGIKAIWRLCDCLVILSLNKYLVKMLEVRESSTANISCYLFKDSCKRSRIYTKTIQSFVQGTSYYRVLDKKQVYPQKAPL